jgi:hypothetical protein
VGRAGGAGTKTAGAGATFRAGRRKRVGGSRGRRRRNRPGPARDQAERALAAHVGAARAARRAEALARLGAAQAALAEALRPLAGAVAVAAAEAWATGGKGPLDLELGQLPAELVAPRQVPPAPPADGKAYGYHADGAAERLAALNPPPPNRNVEHAGGIPAPPDQVLFGRTGR